MPSADSYSTADVTALNTHRTPIQKQPEALLCLVGLSQSYFLGDDVYPTFLYDDDQDMDLFNLISASNLTKVKTGTQPRTTYKMRLLTATASRVDGLSREILLVENPTTTEDVLEPDLEKEVAAIGPLVNKRHRKKGNDEADANAPPNVLRKDHAVPHAQSTSRGKSLALMGLEAGSTFFTPTTQETPTDAKSVRDPDLLSYRKSQPYLERDVAQSSRKMATKIPTGNVATTEVQGQIFMESPESGKSASFPSASGSPRSIYQLDDRGSSLGHWHGLRLAVMKCAESPELRHAFANVVSIGLVKVMSEGLKHGIEHGKAGRDLAAIEAYELEADSKYVKVLQDLKDLKVVCRTHGVGSAHHARSDGILVYVPTIAPQGLAILLADAATQTKVADEEDEPHPRLQQSISLPPFYNLELK
ncbi:hypothetical protein Tco_0597915 [Tanacetum coccineum]